MKQDFENAGCLAAVLLSLIFFFILSTINYFTL